MTRTLLLAILLCVLTSCGGDGSSDGASVASGSVDIPPPPQEDVCGADERITATVVVDAAIDRVHGMHTRLAYPAGLIIPGGAEEESVRERITFIPVQAALDAGHPFPLALPTVNDQESRVQTLLSSLDSFAVGPFVAITFDCVEGRTRPVADDFPCEVAGATDLQFMDLYDSTCRAELASSS